MQRVYSKSSPRFTHRKLEKATLDSQFCLWAQKVSYLFSNLRPQGYLKIHYK